MDLILYFIKFDGLLSTYNAYYIIIFHRSGSFLILFIRNWGYALCIIFLYYACQYLIKCKTLNILFFQFNLKILIKLNEHIFNLSIFLYCFLFYLIITVWVYLLLFKCVGPAWCKRIKFTEFFFKQLYFQFLKLFFYCD